MKSSTRLSWALCLCLFSASYSSRILQLALAMYLRLGMAEGMQLYYGWDVVAILVGAVLGPLLVWVLSPYLNRKHLVLIGLAITTLSAILTVSANRAVQVVIGAGCVGISNTMILTTATLWQAENADPRHRGQKVVLLLVSAAAGNAFCSWLTYILHRASPPTMAGVRALVGIQLVFIAVASILVLFSTDSYRWFLSHNKPEKARAALASMRDQDESSPEVASYFSSLLEHRRQLDSGPVWPCCAIKRKSTGSSGGLLQLHTPRRLALAVGVGIMAALTGVQASSYYMSYLLDTLFTSPSTSATGSPLLAAFLPTLDLLFTLLPYYLLPRLGLRKLLIIGCIGMSLFGTLTLITASVTPTTTTTTATITRRSLDLTNPLAPRPAGPSAALFTLLLLTVLFFDLSWSTLTWLVAAELGPSLAPLPPSSSSNNTPYTISSNTTLLTLTVATRYALEIGMAFGLAAGIASAGYLLMAACLVVNAVFAGVVWAFYPETTGRSLEEVDVYFAGAPRVLVGRDGSGARRVWRRRGRSEGYGTGTGAAAVGWGRRWADGHGVAEEMVRPAGVGGAHGRRESCK